MLTSVPSTPSYDRSRPRVAVVDDDRAYLELVREVLEDEGYEVDTLDDVRAGYRFIQEWQPDLVIMDLMQERQPVGLGVLAALREDPILRDVPLIVISADAVRLARLASHFRQHADVATLGKPFDLQDMLNLIEAMLFEPDELQAVAR